MAAASPACVMPLDRARHRYRRHSVTRRRDRRRCWHSIRGARRPRPLHGDGHRRSRPGWFAGSRRFHSRSAGTHAGDGPASDLGARRFLPPCLMTPGHGIPLDPPDGQVWLNPGRSAAGGCGSMRRCLAPPAYRLRWMGARARRSRRQTAVQRASSLLMGRHDALRLRIGDELPRRWVDASVEPPVRVCRSDESTQTSGSRPTSPDRVAAAALGHHSAVPDRLIRAGASHGYLVWRFHLIADSVSRSR